MDIENKVGNEKQKILDSVVNDYRSEISKKNDKIHEMEILSKNNYEFINIETNYKVLLGQMRQSLSEKN